MKGHKHMYFEKTDPRSWFCRPQTGLFVHWGLYAINALHEQERTRFHVPKSKYEKLATIFNPTAFDPHAWIDLAQKAGMEYLVFTAKHGDGFCLWDTQTTDFKVTKTPYGRDIVLELAQACQERSFPLCLYYAPFDNHCPYRINFLERDDDQFTPDIDLYLAYIKTQIRELCTNYGTLHGFWFDHGHNGLLDSSINLLIRKLQPAAVINDRGFSKGDFATPERNYNEKEYGPLRVFTSLTETCEAIGMNSWGYRKDEDYFTSRHLIREIDKSLARGGNYLLNVGPTAEGRITERFTDVLSKIGFWYAKVRESYEAVEPISDQLSDPEVFLTQRDKTIMSI